MREDLCGMSVLLTAGARVEHDVEAFEFNGVAGDGERAVGAVCRRGVKIVEWRPEGGGVCGEWH